MILDSSTATTTRTRQQRKAAGYGLRRVASLLAAFALTLTGLATPAHAAASPIHIPEGCQA